MDPEVVRVDWEALAVAIVKYGAAVAIIWRFMKEASSAIRATFVSGVDLHVKPLFDKLGDSVDRLTESVDSLKTDHGRAIVRLDNVEETLGEFSERVARVEERTPK